MKKNILSVALILAGYSLSFGQNVGIGTLTPDASALLELNTTSKGFLPPRMTAAQKALIPTPKAGLIVYQTDASAGLYVYNGSAWVAAAGSGAVLTGWSTTGNAGTLSATHFIGTTDNIPLKFRVNNLPSGELNATNANMAYGVYALANNTTGAENTAIGYNSLNKNTLGGANTAVGVATLYSNTYGSNNTAIGFGTLTANTTGSENLAAGFFSMYLNNTGKDNVALGSSTLYSNLSGSANVAIGKSALQYNKDVSNLVAIGDSALFNNGRGNPQGSQATGNTAVGSKTLYANTIGAANTANGYQALYSNTSGAENTAIGYNSLNNNELGNSNTAIGVASLYSNTYGSNNTAIGLGTLSANTTGSENLAAGFFSMYLNKTGKDNVALGSSALYSNLSGSSNVAIGKNALQYNSKSSSLVAIGESALFSNGRGITNASHAIYNTAVGSKALYENTSGYANTAQGFQALYSNTTGFNNNAFGSDALGRNETGSYNVAMGEATLKFNITGSFNTGIGQSAFVFGNNGSYNSGIGAITSLAADNLTNATAIGARAEVACSNCLVLGSVNGENNATSSVKVGIGITAPLADLHIKQSKETYPVNGGGLRLERLTNASHWDIATDNTDDLDFTYNGVSRGYINHTTGVYTATSDIRMKKDIKVIETVLPRIMQLQAKTYHYLDNKSDDILSYGFMAQEVETVFPDFVTTKGKDGLKAIAYQNFTVITVKALQEQQAQIELLKEENKLLKNRLDKLQAAIENMQHK